MPRKMRAATPDDWRKAVYDYIARHPDRPLKARGLAREIGVPPDRQTEFRGLIRRLLDEGALGLGRGRSLTLTERSGRLTGVLRLNRRGFGFVEVLGHPDFFIRQSGIGDALDGDTVEIEVIRPRRGGGRMRGHIVRVVERAEIRWVGVLQASPSGYFVQPEGRAPAPRVQIADPKAKGARPGELVMVEPLTHTLHQRIVQGVIIERLGEPDRTRTQILGVVRRYGIPDQFTAETRRAAQRSAARFDPERLAGREDLRDLLTITIDPPDARDFDDAITLQEVGDGQFELGVHIADVSHFVRPGTTLDREAQERSTSAYFPGYVVPMLPETLSNGVCSLQPDQPRYARSVFITYDHKARPAATRFARSVIRSDRRFTYDEVTAFLENRDKSLEPRFAKLLKQAEALARRIRQRRLADGMLVLNLPEVEIRLDEHGDVTDAGPADTSFSHTIIEMFMVEANEAVSRGLREAGLEHLRRVHPPPEGEETPAMGVLAALTGERVPRVLDRAAMARLLSSVRGKPAEPAVNMMLLRSMCQAMYSPEPEGHFALASQDYCHFTSPIRRYPDLVNHRLLDLLPKGKRKSSRQKKDSYEPDLVELGRHCSQQERRAVDAEREAKTLLLLGLMQTKLGQTFDAVITNVVSFGIFVQVQPYMAEGLIATTDLGPDVWDFDDRAATFTGRRTGRVIVIGQKVRVVVAAVDERRQEMVLVPAPGVRLGEPVAGPLAAAPAEGEPRRSKRPWRRKRARR